jgi:hypothetical protein
MKISFTTPRRFNRRTGGEAMSAIANAFARIRREGRGGFIPYITAGDPDLAAT